MFKVTSMEIPTTSSGSRNDIRNSDIARHMTYHGISDNLTFIQVIERDGELMFFWKKNEK